MVVNATVPAGQRPPIRLGFTGFWDTFDPRDNYFTRLLSRRYAVAVCDRPDFLIHSCIGKGRHDHRRHDCVRIFYTGENVPPDWLSTDWAFTFEHDPHPRHFRLPHWPFYVDPAKLVKPADVDPERLLAAKTRFCGFVVSNRLCNVRNEFFRRLSRYKPVDSGGKLMNTLGHRVAEALGRSVLVMPLPLTLALPTSFVIEKFWNLCGQASIVSPDKLREATAASWAASGRRARQELGFAPRSSLNTRLRETADWLRKHNQL